MNKLKSWFVDKKDKAKNFCKEHPDVVLTLIGGLASLGGGIIKIKSMKNEYEDNCFTEIDGTVYKIPAKQMKTMKNISSDEDK